MAAAANDEPKKQVRFLPLHHAPLPPFHSAAVRLCLMNEKSEDLNQEVVLMSVQSFSNLASYSATAC